MKVIERSIIAKTGTTKDCEDGIVFTEHFAAVVDGTTDKTGRRYNDLAGGRFAMLILTEAIAHLPRDVEANRAIELLSAALAKYLPLNLTPEDLPSAAVAIFSNARREVWQVGDVGFWFCGQSHDQRRKQVDRINISMRAAILFAELMRGTTLEQLTQHDPGREAIMPLLSRQALFANNADGGQLAFGVVDGRPVPISLIDVTHVPSDATELVLASDGYPQLYSSLAEAEANLAKLLISDPLCIGPLAGTKGLRPGNISFDDRAYLRVRI
jgi:hypothetical protein